jgi:hypothetical protein
VSKIRWVLEATTEKSREYTRIDRHRQGLPHQNLAQQLKERIDKCDYMKLKSFCTKKEMFLN